MMSECALVEVQHPAQRLNWTKSGVFFLLCFLLEQPFVPILPSQHTRPLLSPAVVHDGSPCPRLDYCVARLPRRSNGLWRTSINRGRRSQNSITRGTPPTPSRASAALAQGLRITLVGERVLFLPTPYLAYSLPLHLQDRNNNIPNRKDRLQIDWSNRLRAAKSPTNISEAHRSCDPRHVGHRPLALARDRRHLDF